MERGKRCSEGTIERTNLDEIGTIKARQGGRDAPCSLACSQRHISEGRGKCVGCSDRISAPLLPKLESVAALPRLRPTEGDVDLAARICRAFLPRGRSITFPHGRTDRQKLRQREIREKRFRRVMPLATIYGPSEARLSCEAEGGLYITRCPVWKRKRTFQK